MKEIDRCVEAIKKATEGYGKKSKKEERDKFRKEINSLGKKIFEATKEFYGEE